MRREIASDPGAQSGIVALDSARGRSDDDAMIGEDAPNDGIGADDAPLPKDGARLDASAHSYKAVLADARPLVCHSLLQNGQFHILIIMLDIGDGHITGDQASRAYIKISHAGHMEALPYCHIIMYGETPHPKDFSA